MKLLSITILLILVGFSGCHTTKKIVSIKKNDTTYFKAPDTLYAIFSGTDTTGFAFKDSCFWNAKTDTVRPDYVLVIDEKTGFVKRIKSPLIIFSYEEEHCQTYVGSAMYNLQEAAWQPKRRNKNLCINGVDFDIKDFILYRTTENNYETIQF